MTEISDARESIYQAFKDAWGTTTPYYFDNEVAERQEVNWVRLVVRHNQAEQETLGPVGARKFERSGSVIVQVFTVLDKGTTDGDTLVEAVRDVFEGKTIGNVRFNGVIVREIGSDDLWFQYNVEAPFNYDKTK